LRRSKHDSYFWHKEGMGIIQAITKPVDKSKIRRAI
jgi:hypothetical protein